MIEVEAKIRLTEAERKRVASELPRFAGEGRETLKRDRYYGEPDTTLPYRKGKPIQFLRIREEDGEAIVGLKDQQREKGIEANEEIEFPIDHAGKWDRLIREIGFPLFAAKEKRSLAFCFGPYHLELNRVRGLGWFLEIERLVNRESQVAAAKKGVVDLFGRLGFTQERFETKLYLELLAEKRKK
jgi:adenylate cyclase class 2